MHLINTFEKWGFPGGSGGKASTCNVGDLSFIPGSGRSPGEWNGNPLQYSCLENSMDGGALWAKVHGVAKSWIQLSDFSRHSLFSLSFHFWKLTPAYLDIKQKRMHQKVSQVRNYVRLKWCLCNIYQWVLIALMFIPKIQNRWQRSGFLNLFKKEFLHCSVYEET